VTFTVWQCVVLMGWVMVVWRAVAGGAQCGERQCMSELRGIEPVSMLVVMAGWPVVRGRGVGSMFTLVHRACIIHGV
jgi:hypothetical protein